LVDGLCHCVQWSKSVRYMVDCGVDQFIEFGPARVLSSLIKRIDSEVEAVTISNADSIRKLVDR
jgi:[acyl-carrier-protein] S-malonyltransferase